MGPGGRWGHRAGMCRWECICVRMFLSVDFNVSVCSLVCVYLWDLHVEASHLGLELPSWALEWGAWIKQPTHLPSLTDCFLLQNNAQRLGVSQSTHSLTTPVVSVATPSLLSQGLPFSSMPTAYNTGECSCYM